MTCVHPTRCRSRQTCPSHVSVAVRCMSSSCCHFGTCHATPTRRVPATAPTGQLALLTCWSGPAAALASRTRTYAPHAAWHIRHAHVHVHPTRHARFSSGYSARHMDSHTRARQSHAPLLLHTLCGILIPIESCCRTVTATSFTRSIVARSTLLPHACKFEIHRPRQNKGELRRQHAPRTSTIESHRNHVPEV